MKLSTWIGTFVFLVLISPALWAAQSYYLRYPTGHISLESVYDELNQERMKLRACHRTYLEQIPGAYDPLTLTFQIDPEGRAVFFDTLTKNSPKATGIKCIQNVISSVAFARPKMGIVFIKYESDVRMTEKNHQKSLSRNALMVVPLLPQKLVDAMIEMYVPFYKRCFLHAPKTKRPMNLELSWIITQQGLPETIVVEASPFDEKVTTCMIKVTQEHRYPSGYAVTKVKRAFDIK